MEYCVDSLRGRIAKALGWTFAEAQSLPLVSLREIVRPVSPKLAHEITCALAGDITIVRRTP